MGKSCSKAISCIENKQKEYQCLTIERLDNSGYLLVDIDFWKTPDCLICLEEVKYADPKCIKCDINNCTIITHAKCMNRWYKENMTCPICQVYLSKRPEIHFAHDSVNIAKKN